MISGRIKEWSIVLVDNLAGHCFPLRDLIPMKFLKWAMIVQLKMCTVGKIFGKSCLKAIRDIAYFWWG